MVLALSSCATVKIKNAEFCGDLGEDGAACYETLTTNHRDIPKDKWDAERFGQICTKAPVFADWKAAIEKLCSVSKRCTYEQKKQIQRFFLNLQKVKIRLR